jgi:hypothetical protein
VLIPGIILAFYAAIKYRKLVSPITVIWIVLWAMACTYFAGEEASWGQWYFGWESPEWFESVNDQGETNLHNMSSWADQKPRALVELFILISGVIIPLCRMLGIGKPPTDSFISSGSSRSTRCCPRACSSCSSASPGGSRPCTRASAIRNCASSRSPGSSRCT